MGNIAEKILDACPTLQRCCCCVPLHAGVIVIGVVGLLLGFPTTFICGVEVKNLPPRKALLTPGSSDLPFDFKLLVWSGFLLGLVVSAANVMLLVGRQRESPNLCRLYLYSIPLVWILETCLLGVAVLMNKEEGYKLLYELPLPYIFVILVTFYCALVVVNYRRMLFES